MEVSTSLAATEDPSSLRARALSTLKLKRKRPAHQQLKGPTMLPARPQQTADSFQLDYGQDESTSEPSPPPQPAPSTSIKPATSGPEQDISMREEGEISEEDEPPAKPTPPTRKATPKGPRRNRDSEAKLSLLDRLSDPTPEHGLPKKPIHVYAQSSPKQPAPLAPPPLEISPDQVRPNVLLNQSDYDRAKDIVLDLLGWGVTPEYLAASGLTREMVFYAFRELNLRLPSNFDTTGLTPYTPETISKFTITTRRQPSSQPTLSLGSASAKVSAPPTPQPQEDLSDIERQRRQELVARKAALASRKSRPVITTETKLASLGSNQTPRFEAEVEDFLKSITPTAESKDVVAAPVPIDIDPPPVVPSSLLAASSTDSKTQSPSGSSLDPPPSSASTCDPPPSSTNSTTSTFAIPVRASPQPLTPMEPPRLSGNALSFVSQYHPRKSGKRPVASDFVDVEGQPRGILKAGATDSIPPDNSHQAIKRKTGTGSFVNIRHTKCVIDLSDTESEEEEEEALGSSSSRGSVNAPPPPGPSVVSQALLEKKEREIQRMKDLIAQHEQKSRLKKMASQADSTKPTTISRVTTSFYGFAPRNASLITADDAPLGTPVAVTKEPTTLSNSDPSAEQCTSQEAPEEVVNNIAVDDAYRANSSDPVPTQITPMDVDDPLAHIEADNDVPPDGCVSYNSLFTSYPSLRLSLPSPSQSKHVDLVDQCSLSEVTDSFPPFLSRSSSSGFEHLPIPDLSGLRMTAFTKKVDPLQQICQFEVPGGGICRDASCKDLHLSQLDGDPSQLEPSDDDVARYLCNCASIAPFEKVLSALRHARLKDPNASLETCVASVMKLLRPVSI